MAREKITHLFNKNHIEILKIEHPELSSMIPRVAKIDYVSSNTYTYRRSWGIYGDKPKYKIVKKESKLGFYYESKVLVKRKSL